MLVTVLAEVQWLVRYAIGVMAIPAKRLWPSAPASYPPASSSVLEDHLNGVDRGTSYPAASIQGAWQLIFLPANPI